MVCYHFEKLNHCDKRNDLGPNMGNGKGKGKDKGKGKKGKGKKANLAIDLKNQQQLHLEYRQLT